MCKDDESVRKNVERLFEEFSEELIFFGIF